jgi:histone H3/H4
MDYVIIKDIGDWRLKKDAPEYVREAFKEFIKSLDMIEIN